MDGKRNYPTLFFAPALRLKASSLRYFSLLILLFSIAGCDSEPEKSPPASPALQQIAAPETGMIANVNGENILPQHFNALYRHELDRKKLPSDAGLAQAYALKIKQRLARKLIDETLVRQKAEARNIKVDQTEISAALEAFAASFPSQQMYRRHIAAYPGGEEGMNNTIALRLLKNRLSGADGLAPPTDDDAKRYYDEHRDAYQIPPHLTVQSIRLTLKSDSTDEDKWALLKKAEQLQRKVREGKDDFAVLARRHSQHASAHIGGYLGRVTQDTVAPQLWKALRTLKAGEISGVVETGEGFYILRLVSRNPARIRNFAEVKKEIKANIGARLESASNARLMAKLRADAVVENYLNARYANPSGLAAQPKGQKPTKSPYLRENIAAKGSST